MSSFQRMRNRESKQNNFNSNELATVTSPNSGEGIHANGVGEYREIPIVAPFGIRWNPPSGQSVQLIKNWSNGKSIVAVGTEVDQNITPGEFEIYSQGGATVKCRNNGDVIVNNLVVIKQDGSIAIPKDVSIEGSLFVKQGITSKDTVKATDFITIPKEE